MRVLVLNCGSSSVKFQLMSAERGACEPSRVLARGIVCDAGGATVAECTLRDGTRGRFLRPPGGCGAGVEPAGLYGVSGVGNDMRALLEAESQGHERAGLAVDLFCYRVKKYVAACSGVLGGVDASAFAGGIGENAGGVRERSLAGLAGLGIRLDPERNAAGGGGEVEISAPTSATRVWVVPTDEEWPIARDTLRIVAGDGGT